MSIVAIIPARGGSKGVPGKNLRRVAGRSLVARAIDAAQGARSIDRVVVSTDDAAIAAAARDAGAEIVIRPGALSGDTASSEAALLHALDHLSPAPDIVVFIQATSPFIDSTDLELAVRRVRDGNEDVVFSAVETFAFLWKPTPTGAVGVNHDASIRPRRQDRDAHFQETGAFYVMRVPGFRTAGHRFFGHIGIAELDPARALEIDTERELEVAGLVSTLFASTGPIDVDALVTDFDGVHTDDRVLVASDGSESVMTSRSDGAGVAALREAGIPMLILSKETNPVVSARARKLGIDVLQGIEDKAEALTSWAAGAGIPFDRIGYVGNDLNDLGVMGLVGWPIAVADARPEILHAARTVLAARGGHGAVREAADRLLASKLELATASQSHSNH